MKKEVKDFVTVCKMDQKSLHSALKVVLEGYDYQVHDGEKWLLGIGGNVSEKRRKSPPAFDSFDLNSAENELFGNKKQNAQHFTEYSLKHSKQNGGMAKEEVIKCMNPMNYLEDEEVNIPRYWRIRHGTSDSHTSPVIPVILAIKLQNLGYEVDFFLPWKQGHGGDYDLEELFQWMDEIVKKDRR